MEWFYEQNGQPVGPVSRGEVLRLILQRRILPQTLVWTPAFGDQWRPAAKAGLITSLNGRMPAQAAPHPSLQASSQRASAEFTPAMAEVAGRVPSFWAWVLVLAPAFLAIFLEIMEYVRPNAMSPDMALISNIALWIISIVAMVQDRATLAEAGFMPPSMWWLLFRPGYFWVRAERLGGRGKNLFYVWLVLCFVQMGVILYDPPPALTNGQNIGWSQFLPAHKDRRNTPSLSPEKAAPSGPSEEQSSDASNPAAQDAGKNESEQVQL